MIVLSLSNYCLVEKDLRSKTDLCLGQSLAMPVFRSATLISLTQTIFMLQLSVLWG